MDSTRFENKALLSIKYFLNQNQQDLRQHGLPDPGNIEEIEEDAQLIGGLAYQSDLNEDQVNLLYESLNGDQKTVFDYVLTSVEGSQGKFIFVEAPGGTGKTYLLNAIIDKVASIQKKVTACASSGIASILLKGGGTLHSKFKIPIEIEDDTICNIPRHSRLASQIRELDLIIWDEAPMFSKSILETLDRTLKDVRKNDSIFGGITVVLSGDWRQILPIVSGERADTVASVHKRSDLWEQVKKFELRNNMRIRGNDASAEEFKSFVLSIGDGSANQEENTLLIPERFIYPGNTISGFIDEIFPDLQSKIGDEGYMDWITERAIIASRNDQVNQINEIALNKMAGDTQVFYSFDKNVETGQNRDLLSVDTLNKLEVPGIPSHTLKLKVGAPVTLMWNLDPGSGHCNGTRYVIQAIHTHLIELKVAIGPYKGDTFMVPRIEFVNKDKRSMPVVFSRKQFPIKVCFAFTSNKSQGQSLNNVGICVMQDFFTHGQFYVAISRVTEAQNLKILLPDRHQRKTVSNIVYKEVFRY